MNWPCAPANPGWLHMSMDHDSCRLGLSGSHGRRDSALLGSYTGASSWTVLRNLTWNMELPTTISYWETFVFFNIFNKRLQAGSVRWLSCLDCLSEWHFVCVKFCVEILIFLDIVYCMYPWIIFQCLLFSQQNSRTTFESVLANVPRHCDHWDKQNAARRKSFTKSPVVRCVSFPIWRIWTRWVYWLQWKFMQLAMTWRICSIISWMSC